MTEWLRRHGEPILGAVLAASLVVAGCDSTLGGTIVLRNQTAETLTVLSPGPAGSTQLVTLRPGQSSTLKVALDPRGCMSEPLVARGNNGRVIAKQDLPICEGSVWTITPDDAPVP